MADAPVIAKEGSAVHAFLHGTKWKHTYARLSLPILVRWAEGESINPNRRAIEHTYKDLAIAAGVPDHYHPMQGALGAIGDALQELHKKHRPLFPTEVPPIELLVWSKGKGRPGDSGFWFVGISREQRKHYSESSLRLIAQQQRVKIVAYPHWRRVLRALNLKPLTIDLPSVESVIAAPGFTGGGAGESKEHLRMKYYVAENYRLAGIKGKYKAELEEILLSGDKLDVLLNSIPEGKRVAIEVKSRISPDADLIRGLFQCVKYRAVLEAHEVYKSHELPLWVP
jgi:hypothetical protein